MFKAVIFSVLVAAALASEGKKSRLEIFSQNLAKVILHNA